MEVSEIFKIFISTGPSALVYSFICMIMVKYAKIPFKNITDKCVKEDTKYKLNKLIIFLPFIFSIGLAYFDKYIFNPAISNEQVFALSATIGSTAILIYNILSKAYNRKTEFDDTEAGSAIYQAMIMQLGTRSQALAMLQTIAKITDMNCDTALSDIKNILTGIIPSDTIDFFAKKIHDYFKSKITPDIVIPVDDSLLNAKIDEVKKSIIVAQGVLSELENTVTKP